MTRTLIRMAMTALAVLIPLAAQGGAVTTEAPLKLPYVYTKWKQFTVKEGLPSDYVFAVKVHGNDVWVGTEGGLALIDKQQAKVVKVWTEKDGLPFQAITGLDVDPSTGDVWVPLKLTNGA